MNQLMMPPLQNQISNSILDVVDFRRLAYQLFAGCLLGPPSPHLFSPFFAPRSWNNGACSLLWPEIQDLCREASTSKTPEQFALEYAALLVAPGPWNTAPYQSDRQLARRSGAAAADGSSSAVIRLRLQRLFAEWDFSPGGGDGDLAPDHAGLVLAFLEHIVAAERARWEVDLFCTRAILAVEADFLRDHVWNWFPGWLECLYVRAEVPFYRSLALVLGKFLETEKTTVELLSAKCTTEQP